MPLRQNGKYPEKAEKSQQNGQKPLDFCLYKVYDNDKSDQLNIVCHFRTGSGMVANIYDRLVASAYKPPVSCANTLLTEQG